LLPQPIAEWQLENQTSMLHPGSASAFLTSTEQNTTAAHSANELQRYSPQIADAPAGADKPKAAGSQTISSSSLLEAFLSSFLYFYTAVETIFAPMTNIQHRGPEQRRQRD
jgi:hypothetical protein